LPHSGPEETRNDDHEFRQSKDLPDDPRLTAYALGEIEGDERAAVEAALRGDAALRAAVEDIRAAAAQLECALATEALPAAPGMKPAADVKALARPVRGVLLRFPQAYFVVSGLAAACFMVFVMVRDPDARPVAAVTEGKVYTVLNLPPAESAVAASEPEAPDLVAVPPKTVMLQVPDFSQDAAPSPEASRKDESLLGQAGNSIPPTPSALDAAKEGTGTTPGTFLREKAITLETQPMRKLAGNDAGENGGARRWFLKNPSAVRRSQERSVLKFTPSPSPPSGRGWRTSRGARKITPTARTANF